MKYSKGIMWLDDCRIPFVDETEMDGVCKSDKTIVIIWGRAFLNIKSLNNLIISPSLIALLFEFTKVVLLSETYRKSIGDQHA